MNGWIDGLIDRSMLNDRLIEWLIAVDSYESQTVHDVSKDGRWANISYMMHDPVKKQS